MDLEDAKVGHDGHRGNCEALFFLFFPAATMPVVAKKPSTGGSSKSPYSKPVKKTKASKRRGNKVNDESVRNSLDGSFRTALQNGVSGLGRSSEV
jgi:hypothetical protein